MKKRILFITILTIIGLIIIFNIPLSESKNWSTNLINGYLIKKEAETKITLGKIEDNKYISIISDYIAEYGYGEKYILLKCLNNEDELKVVFYIIDTINNNIYGPYYNYQDFIDKQEEIIDERIGDYVKTINYKE